MKIGIIVAMHKEFMQLVGLLDDKNEIERGGRTFVTGQIDAHQVILHECGIGKVNSALGAAEMIREFTPQLIISSGVAGGADPNLKPMDVVVGTSYRYHDLYCGTEVEYGCAPGMPSGFESPRTVVDTAMTLDTDCHIREGLVVTGDWFVDDKVKMEEILKHFPEALAVDMESCSIAHTCHVYRVPFISFRIISDVPLSGAEVAQYQNFWQDAACHSFGVTRRFISAIK